MALNEDALESMLERDGDAPRRYSVQLAEQNDEFEVYERAQPRDKMTDEVKEAPPETPAAPAGPPSSPAAPAAPPQPAAQPATSAPAPAPESTPVPQPAQAPAPESARPVPSTSAPSSQPAAPEAGQPGASESHFWRPSPQAPTTPRQPQTAPEPAPRTTPEPASQVEPAAASEPTAPATPTPAAEEPTWEVPLEPAQELAQEPAQEPAWQPTIEEPSWESPPTAPAETRAAPTLRFPGTTERPPRLNIDAAEAPTPSGPEPERPDAPAQPSTGPAGGDGRPHIALVQASFNGQVTDEMARLAQERARQLGATVVQHVQVPGAMDLPLTCKLLAARDDVEAVVALGCVIQGETGHDLTITDATAHLLARLAYEQEVPVGFGVVGPRMTREQAQARVEVGAHAMESAVRQWRTLRAVADPAWVDATQYEALGH